MQFLKKSAPFGVLLAASVLAACQTTSTQAGSGEVKLSTSEVRATFIGKPWRGDGSGRFHFKNDGIYTYKNSKISVFGSYVVKNSGKVCATNAAKSYKPNRRPALPSIAMAPSTAISMTVRANTGLPPSSRCSHEKIKTV